MTNAIKGKKGYQSIDAEKRFWEKVSKTETCWLWTGASNNKWGYGVFWESGKRILASRWSFQKFVGPIPNGHFVLHRCDNPPCVNPKHLFTGTHDDNMKDAKAKGRTSRKRTHCLKGHPKSGPNLYTDKNGKMYCKACQVIYKQKKKLINQVGSSQGDK